MRRIQTALVILACCSKLSPTLLAELPLPSVTIYGKISTQAGAPVTAGTLKAKVRRGAAVILETPGAFKEAEGAFWYIVRIPMETTIGAPGPSGAGARDGDVVEALLLNGSPLELKSSPAALKAGAVARIDAIASQVNLPYARGDCNADSAVDITDAIRVLYYLFIAPDVPPCLEACDHDGSNALDITDAVFLLSFLFLDQPPPPPPGTQCGADPEPSALGCIQSPCPGGV